MSRSQSNPLKTQFYDQFLFIDSLTNRSIAVRDVRRDTKRKTTKISHPRESEQQEIKELDECISLLKDTLLFKKQHLREKDLGITLCSAFNTPQEGRETVRKRRIVRNLLKDTISERNRLEFQKYIQCSSHRPDKELIQISRRRYIPISKENITKIVDVLQTKQLTKEIPEKKTLQNFEKEPLIQNLASLESEIEKEVRGKLRRTGLFLIQEKKANVTKQWKSDKLKSPFVENRVHMETIREIKWQTASLENSQVNFKPKKIVFKPNRRNIKAIEKLFEVVQTGELSDVEVIVGRHSKEILRERDERGNTPMHICANLNKALIFQWLLRVRGIESLLEKNTDGETPVSIAVNRGHRQVLNFVPPSFI